MALKNVNIPLNIKDFPSSTTVSNCAYIGENNEIANANNILIIGNNINWKGHGGPQSNTLVVGENLTSQSGTFDDYKNQVVIGEFNEPSSTQGSYLVVGDGTGKNELAHNILVVKKGRVNINGSLNINGSTGSSVTINAPINSDITLVNSSICFDDNNGPTIYGSSSSKYLSLTSPNGSINLNISQEQADPNIRLSSKGTDITGNTSISGNLTVSNDVTISGNLTIPNNVAISGNLNVSGENSVIDLSSSSSALLPSNTTIKKGADSYPILNEKDRSIAHLFFKDITVGGGVIFNSDTYLYVQIPLQRDCSSGILSHSYAPGVGAYAYKFEKGNLGNCLTSNSLDNLSMILPVYEVTYDTDKSNSNPSNPLTIKNIILSDTYFISIYVSAGTTVAYFVDQISTGLNSNLTDLFTIKFDTCYIYYQ